MDAESSSNGIDTSVATKDDNSHIVDPEDEKVHLLERKKSLIQKLETIRMNRCSAQRHIRQMTQLIDEWNHAYNAAEYEHSKKLTELGNVLHKEKYLKQRIELYSRCNVIHDCFTIGYKGKYGTINGLRIGFVDQRTTETTLNNHDAGDKGLTTPKGYMRIGPSNNGDIELILTSTLRQSSIHKNSFSQSKITWLEVNAALGLTAHLLFVLQRKQDCFIRFTSYEIMPMGCYTKIGEKQQDTKPPIWYNLYYNDEHSLSFLFSQRRMFNKALHGLGICLAEAIACATKRDRTLVIPYSVVVNAKGILCIENVPITLSTCGEEWTTVMKYFLTNLKWLVVYAAKHVDR